MADEGAASPGRGKRATYTIDQALELVPLSNRPRLFTLLACTLTWTLDGMEVLLLAFIGPALRCDWGLSDAQVASLSSAVFLGMMCGSVLWGWVADRYGRVRSLTLSTITALISSIACALAPSFGVLLAMRAVAGASIVGGTVSVTLLVEIAPARLRGRFTICLNVGWSLGAVALAALAGTVMTSLGWRWLVVCASAPALGVLALLAFVPESPRYQLAANNSRAAEDSLGRMLRASGRRLPEGALEAPAPLLSASRGKRRAGDMRALFDTPALRRTTLAAWAVMFCGGFSYYGAVIVTTELLAADPCGYHAAEAAAAAEQGGALARCGALTPQDYTRNLIATAGELPGELLAFALIDAVARGPLSAGVALSLALTLAALVPCTSAGAVSALLFAMRVLSCALFIVIFVLTASLYPTAIRALGMGWAISISRVGAMVTPLVAQLLGRLSMRAALGSYALVAACCAAFALTAPRAERAGDGECGVDLLM